MPLNITTLIKKMYALPKLIYKFLNFMWKNKHARIPFFKNLKEKNYKVKVAYTVPDIKIWNFYN